MKITRNVIQDLLPVYTAGEANPDTVALVEEFLRQDPDLARTAEALRSSLLPDAPIPLQPAHEKQTLDTTRRFLRWRMVLMAFAIFLTAMPLSFGFANGRITWTFLHGTSPLAAALVCLAALSCWGGFLYVGRRLQSTGL